MNYDFGKFHPVCKVKYVVPAPDGLHIVCMDCGVSANMEAISGKVSPADVCKVGAIAERTIIGKQSVNVDRGQGK